MNLGGYTKIYPCDNMKRFERILDAANEIYQEWTGAKVVRTKKGDIKASTPKPPFTRMRTETRSAVKSANSKSVRSISVNLSKDENDKIIVKANTSNVYDRLSTQQKKTRLENFTSNQYQPFIHFDSNFQSQNPPNPSQDLYIQNISIVKPKAHSSTKSNNSPKHIRLEEILKEKRAMTSMRRNL